jgi:voltage-dependent potassium channel beta subunit
MEYRQLGRTGIRVSALSLGTWINFNQRSGVEFATEMMAQAYAAGVNFFDSAESYAGGQAEEVIGAALKKLGWRRATYLVSTKVFWGLSDHVNEHNTLNRKHMIEAIDGSLFRLGLEHVDLYYCHRPDPTTPIEETVWAMHNVVEWGKALYWGTSEWSAAEIMAAIEIAERHHLHKPVVEQPQYNLLWRERMEKEYHRLFQDYGYGATIWSPLASGVLTGKYNAGIPQGSRGAAPGMDWLRSRFTDEADLAKARRLETLAAEIGLSLPHLALAWCLKNPTVSSVILGASRIEQLQENLKALEALPKLTPDVMEKIDEIVGKIAIAVED